MSAGIIAIVGWLAVLSVILILTAGLILYVFNISQLNTESLDLTEALWESLVRTLDPGTMGQDTGWTFRIIMLFVTIGGIFIVSILIGVISNTIQNKIEDLRKGKSKVIESGHTLILGWSDIIYTIISELITANLNVRNPVIVVLSENDKVFMEDELKNKLSKFKNTKVICRSGNPLDIDDLDIVNPTEAKSIIVISPDIDDADLNSIKTVLALKKISPEDGSLNIICEVKEKKYIKLIHSIAKDDVTTIPSQDIISRIIAQTSRQPGLSSVYQELFDFAGSEIYFSKEPVLTGKTFSEAVLSYEDSCVIGIFDKDGKVLLNPPMNTIISDSDSIIAISEDDDTVRINKNQVSISYDKISNEMEPEIINPERTLIIGWNGMAELIITELNNYVSENSVVTVICEDKYKNDLADIHKLAADLNRINLESVAVKSFDYDDLLKLNIPSYNHIIILSNSRIEDTQKADAKSLITLLTLRNILSCLPGEINIVTEMLNVNNNQLALIENVNDYIISNQLMSLVITQISENKNLNSLLFKILENEGSEIYFKPAERYIQLNAEIDLYTAVYSASKRNEILIGYNKFIEKSGEFRIVVNPKKSELHSFNKGDKIIVFAQN